MQPSSRNVLIAVAALVLFGGGVGLGWVLKPDQVKIEEKVKVVEVEKQVVVVQEKVRVETVRIKDTQVAERYHREKMTSPDGTVREVEDRNIDAVSKETTHDVQVKIVEVEKQVVVDRTVDRVVKVDPVLAQWRAGLMAGVAPRLDNPPATAIVAGLEVEKRIVGPVWAGVWVTGGSPVQQFSLTNVSGGIKLAVEF